ncbi:MAG: nickel pincer cofactor biosynthesis protein LarC [Anaerolineae bacterium]|nr:nickel pincer cofactor biosynthesis protein LarC [Anaerolineae bacterium]
MVLGALLDAGLDVSRLTEQLRLLQLPGWSLRPATVRRAGLRATLAQVAAEESHHHRHYSDIAEMIRSSGISPRARDMALAVFRRLGEAEAHVHGVSLEQVHFHEVGAVDSIVDIVGACVGLDLLGVEEVYGSPLPWTHGRVTTEHGTLPVPAPATAELMRGWPVESVDAEGEWVTPTGAAILTTLARGSSMPPMVVGAIGYGAGTRDPEGRPNVLRLLLGERADGAQSDTVMEVQANLDDVNPEWLPRAMELVLEAGALDATLAPVTMKKGRPGFVLSALCPEPDLPSVAGAILRHTTSLGVRYHRVDRLKLRRDSVAVQTKWGMVQVKLAYLGEERVNAAPEYEDCRRLSEATGTPLKDIYAAALAALDRDR